LPDNSVNSVTTSPAPRRGFVLRPDGILSGAAAARALQEGCGLPLAGGPLVFTLCDIAVADSRALLPLDRLRAWVEGEGHGQETAAALARLTGARRPFAGLSLDRPRIMGVVNVTPDSFSDGGDFADPARAIAQGLALSEAGADILDIGGESTRPRAEPVSLEEELRRTIPVVRALAQAGALVSIDTRRAGVIRAAIAAGAGIVNDVTALAGDPESLAVVAGSSVALVLMHMQGDPRSMQQNPSYADSPREIHDFFVERLAACAAAGIAPDRLAVDPGIGFGKNDRHNIELLQNLALFHELGVAVLLGVSRKSFIARLSRNEAPKNRLAGSLAAGLAGLDRGAQILRVHDVAETRQALAIWQAIAGGVSSPP
jgi:dihydropteroate synthase